LNLLAGLDRPTSGEILVAGTRLHTLNVEAATTFATAASSATAIVRKSGRDLA